MKEFSVSLLIITVSIENRIGSHSHPWSPFSFGRDDVVIENVVLSPITNIDLLKLRWRGSK